MSLRPRRTRPPHEGSGGRMRTLRSGAQSAAVWPQTSHLTSLSLCLGGAAATGLDNACGTGLHQAESGRMCCLCADEGGVRSRIVGPFVSSGPVHQHCIFLGKNKELLPRPSITAEAGLRCTMRTALFPGSRHRGHRASGPFPLGPELPGCQATHVLTYMHTQGECSVHTCTHVCVHTCTPARRRACTHVRARTCIHMHTQG